MRAGEGWLYLAVVIDLFSRQVVGWSLRHGMTSNIVIDALGMAWFRRHPGKHAGLLFHSDQEASTLVALSGMCSRSTASQAR